MADRTAVAIVLASGSGERFGSALPKQFQLLAGKSVLEHSLERFDRHPGIDRVLLVVNPAHRPAAEALLARRSWLKLGPLVDGGATRQLSSTAGVSAVDKGTDWVLIHDAARPLLSPGLITGCLEALRSQAAVSVAVPSTDTVFRLDDQKRVAEIPPRRAMWRGQTPQAFHLSVIREAQRRAAEEGLTDASDDCGLVRRYGLAQIGIVPGEERNFKITTPEDLSLAEWLLGGPGNRP